MARPQHGGMRDMTVGSPAKQILLFTLPLLAGNFLQQLYNMVDSWVVGNYVSDAALAAVGTGFPVIFFFSSLFMGLSTGGTVVISQFYGAGQMDRVHDAVDTIYAAFLRLILPMTADLAPAVTLATRLRSAGVRTQLYTEQKKFKAKMNYADKIGVPYVLFLGDDEIAGNVVGCKDMASGEQTTLPFDETLAIIQKGLAQRSEGTVIVE